MKKKCVCIYPLIVPLAHTDWMIYFRPAKCTEMRFVFGVINKHIVYIFVDGFILHIDKYLSVDKQNR